MPRRRTRPPPPRAPRGNGPPGPSHGKPRHTSSTLKCVCPPSRAPACPAWRALSYSTRSRDGKTPADRTRFQPCGARLYFRHVTHPPTAPVRQLPSAQQAAHNGTMSRRAPRARAYAPDPAAPAGHGCDMPGCEALGEYRAPKSRRNLNRLLLVLPGARARLQLDLGLLQGHVARRDRGATPRRHLVAAPVLATRPARHPSASDDNRLRDPLGGLAAGRVRPGSRGDLTIRPRIARAARHARAELADHPGGG